LEDTSVRVFFMTIVALSFCLSTFTVAKGGVSLCPLPEHFTECPCPSVIPFDYLFS